MRTPLLLTATLLVITVPAAATPVDLELDLESVAVIAPWLDSAGVAEDEPVLGELSLSGTADRILENGVRLRARSTLRLQYDNPSTPGTTASLGAPLFAPGAVSGLAGGLPSSSDALRARVETAYFQIDGGYGEVRFGKDRGVAARFHEGAPDVLSHVRLDSPLLDISGVGSLRTRHDLTGPSAKISYASPRLLGLRAGASFTPEDSADGLDRRTGLDRAGLDGAIENAVELALNGSRLIRSADLRIDAALTWSTAEISVPSAAFPGAYRDRVETLSGGLNLEFRDWSLGASWLGSDDGLLDADYDAWTVGLGREAFGWNWSATYGEAEQTGLDADLEGWRIGARHAFENGPDIAVAYIRDTAIRPTGELRNEGVVFEITLSTEILDISRF